MNYFQNFVNFWVLKRLELLPTDLSLMDLSKDLIENIAMLSAFVNDNRDDWDDHLPYLMMAYRATPHVSTKCSPKLLMFGHEISCPLDIMVRIPPENAGKFCPSLYVNWLESAMSNAFEFVHQNLGIAAQRQ